MQITFHGAARNVTGSKHLITTDKGVRILLDCGMFQGMGDEADELNRNFGFDASGVDYLILSHAHIDHSGLIPRMIGQGFQGEIFCTEATMDLTRILLMDSAKIQEQDAEYENRERERENLDPISPMYTDEDVIECLRLFRIVEYNTPTDITPEIKLLFTDAGHIIGSAAVHLTITEDGRSEVISFSGDVGRYNDLILKSPQKFPQADYILLESTYGNSLHRETEGTEEQFKDIIYDTCIRRKGKVLIPAFSVGRTQEILYILNGLEEKGVLPDVKYYVDSPLSSKATAVLKSHTDNFNPQVKELMKSDEDVFQFKGLSFIHDAAESKALNSNPDPCVIISASGMAEAGRIRHHIRNNIHSDKNTILIVGYCEPNSLGGRLMNGEKVVRIFGQEYDVNADVKVIRSMSAHGDSEDLIRFLSCQDPAQVKKLFLVHGEYDVQTAFAEMLREKGFSDILIPDRHQTVTL